MALHQKTHDPSDLVDALEHVVYEIWKYKQSVAHYFEICAAGGDAAIEFRVLHHRILLEFFYEPPKHKDNIGACEYIEDWKCTHNRANLKWFKDYMTRCHTMLAHVSRARSEIAKRGQKAWDKEWQIVEPHLDETVRDFLGRLSAEHKQTCLEWIRRWSGGNYPGSDVLPTLIALIGQP